MKKLLCMLCFILLFSSCTIEEVDSPTSSSEALSVSKEVSPILPISEKALPALEFNILGKYICTSDYHNDEYFIIHHESIPSITFFEDGSCILNVNYLGGVCEVGGVYNINDNFIQVEVDLHDTIFDGVDSIGEKYMDNKYIFEIISNDLIIIDRGFYTVYAGDPFTK